MIYLLLSIVFSSGLVLIFKLFKQLSVSVFQAIVFNYWSAAVCSFLFLPDKSLLYSGSILEISWLPIALGLGCLFIIVFNLTSITTIHLGVSTAAVSSKLGLVFPVILAFLFYGEPFSFLKGVGILLAFIAVILSSIKEGEEQHYTSGMYLPALVFIGSGVCDSLTQYASKNYLAQSDIEPFTLMLFISAAIAGTIGIAYTMVKKSIKIDVKSIGGGVVLGIVNYFSFVFLLKALASINWGSSVIFPLNNVGIVVFTTVVGIIAFKEKLSFAKIAGLLTACAAIIVIAFAK